MMKTAVKVVIAVMVGFAMAAPVCAVAGMMSNDDVIKLVKAGMGEALILSSIDSSESQFDTSTDALVNLKKAGVSDAIIKRMIEKKANPAGQSASVGPKVSTDKDIYRVGETIRVNFYNAPGLDRDWICIVPAGSPDNEAGDYKYMHPGVVQGVLTFDCPSPGKYEVRAYYNYRRNVYIVSARYGFSVVGDPAQEGAATPDRGRKINPNNPLEANLPPGKGLVYIFREPLFITNIVEVPIKVEGKPIIVMLNSSYYPFIATAGNVSFVADSSLEFVNPPQGEKREVRQLRTAETTVEIKPGFVYYIKLRVMPGLFFLDPVPHLEGAGLIDSYKLTLLK
jgi:hypothetical protein